MMMKIVVSGKVGRYISYAREIWSYYRESTPLSSGHNDCNLLLQPLELGRVTRYVCLLWTLPTPLMILAFSMGSVIISSNYELNDNMQIVISSFKIGDEIPKLKEVKVIFSWFLFKRPHRLSKLCSQQNRRKSITMAHLLVVGLLSFGLYWHGYGCLKATCFFEVDFKTSIYLGQSACLCHA